MFDLDAYLARIGLSGRPGIAEVHRAHTTSIPFENLDPHGGLPVSLELEDLQRKLVGARIIVNEEHRAAQHRAALELFQAEIAPVLRRDIPDPPWPWGPAGSDNLAPVAAGAGGGQR